MKLLISMDACLEAYDLYYGTPLHVACVNEHTDCVKVLLNAGEHHAKQNGEPTEADIEQVKNCFFFVIISLRLGECQ